MKTWVDRILAKFLLERMMIQTAGKTRQAKRGINHQSIQNDNNHLFIITQQVPIHPRRPYQHCNQVWRSKSHVHQPRPGGIWKSQITPLTFPLFQSYEIKIKKLGDLSCHYRKKWLRSTIRICFHERRLQYIESEQIAEWARSVLLHLLLHLFIAKCTRLVPILSTFHWLHISNTLHNRVSQKNQKSEFCYATNPSGFHRLDEPPKKNSAL